jgi:hypothetical protein
MRVASVVHAIAVPNTIAMDGPDERKESLLRFAILASLANNAGSVARATPRDHAGATSPSWAA